MEWYWVGTLIGSVMIVLLLIGVPVSVSLGLAAATFLYFGVGPEQAYSVFGEQIFHHWASFTQMALPLFVLMGGFLFISGTSKEIFDMSSVWLRRVPGGLAIVTIATGTIFATLSGSTLASVATIGTVTLPEMLKRGYDKRLALGAVGAAGGLAHLIPPSIMMVLYATLAEVSIGQMLLAGFVPGLLVAITYAAVAIVWTVRDPSAAPIEASASWGERIRSLRKGIGPIIVVLAVTGTIYFGVATATEAAALGAFTAMLLALVAGRLTPSSLWQTLRSSARTTGFILFIAVAGGILSWVVGYYHIPENLIELSQSMRVSPIIIMLAIQIMYLILGMFMDPIGMIVVTTPIVVPVLSGLGFDLIWFGILLMINIEVAGITPPVGLVLYTVKGIAPKEIKFEDVLHGGLIFCIADIVVLALIIIFPEIALWLPNNMQ